MPGLGFPMPMREEKEGRQIFALVELGLDTMHSNSCNTQL